MSVQSTLTMVRLGRMEKTLRRRTAETNTSEFALIAEKLMTLVPSNSQCARLPKDEGERSLLRALIDQIPDFLFVKDVDSRFILANRAIASAYGTLPGGLIGKTDHDLHPQALADEFLRYEQAVIKTGVPMMNMEESFPDCEGATRWYSTTKIPLRSPDHATVGLIGVSRDITERKQMESFGLQQSLILEMIAKNAPLPTVLKQLVLLIESQLSKVKSSILLLESETGRLRHGAAPSLPDAYNRAVDGVAIGPKVGSCGTAAYRRAPVTVSDIRSDPLWEDYRDLASSFALRSCWSTPIKSHNGTVLGTFAMYSGEVRNPKPSDSKLIETATRIAGIAIERHRSEQQLVHMAHHDALTRLPNRVLCLDRLKAALTAPFAQAHHVALLYIDLDGFKPINDKLGHGIGDAFLRSVGEKLRAVVPSEQTVARLGGDEFAVIQTLTSGDIRQQSASLAAEIVEALSLPILIEAHRVVAGATVGIAIASNDADDPDALMRDADFALYRAKAEERGSVRFFEPAMRILAQQRQTLEADLHRALAAGEFEVYYQPQIELASNEICGFEALLRWNHPVRGLVQPLDFIGVAEEIGLIVPLGEWVMRQACMQAVQWPGSIKVAVNLSPVQFRHAGLLQTVLSALSSSGLPPGRLELEITESVVLLDSEANLGLLLQLRMQGVQVSLDDFGTGYSSLSYLRSFPFTKIKIDRSFVRDLDANPGCLAIVKAVSRLASDLGMRTIAEGIETREQLDQLRNEGCDEGQGFFFSRPVPSHQAALLLENANPDFAFAMAGEAPLQVAAMG